MWPLVEPFSPQSQPQDLTDAAEGVGALWSFAAPADCVSGRGVTRTTAATTVATLSGKALRVAGTGALDRAILRCLAGADKPGSGDFTIFLRFIIRSLVGFCAIGRWNTGGSLTTCDYLLGSSLGFASGTPDTAFSIAVGGSQYTATVSGGFANNNEYMLIGRRRGTSIMVDRYAYIDGSRLSATTTNAGITTINATAARQLKLGEIDLGAAHNTDLDAIAAGLLPYALSDAEVMSLPFDHYRFHLDEETTFMPSAAPAAFKAAWARNANTVITTGARP